MSVQDSSEVRAVYSDVIELAAPGGAADDMAPELVPLDAIEPNPWQGRLAEDPAHVRNLAEDIAANGLLQPGLGRRIGGRVQLAFAHSRWAAFKFLDEAFGVERGNGQAGDRFARFPVILRELTDRQMSDYAAAENGRRKDLTAIEVATAIQKRMADFGLTQLEAGKPFGYTSQSSVAHLLRLLDLPEPMQALVNAHQLPERHARALLPLSKILPDAVLPIAQNIARAPAGRRDEVFDSDVAELIDKHGQSLNENVLWPFEWSEPDIPACAGCDYRIQIAYDDQCANPPCYEAKRARWTQLELERLAEKLGIPIAREDQTSIKPLKITWENDDKAKAYLKRKNRPYLWLMPTPKEERGEWGHHYRLLDSHFVVLGSTDPKLFNASGEKDTAENAPAATAATSSAQVETEAQKAKRLEREEREAEERREARSALRRARYDLVWLILHTAEAMAADMKIEGGILAWCAELTQRYTTNPQYEWPEYDAATRDLFKQVGMFGDTFHPNKLLNVDELVIRRYILVRRFASKVSGFKAEEQFNWARGCQRVQEVAEALRLPLGHGWDQPPIHKTPTNCHVCGQFTPGNEMTGRDLAHGWQGGDVVTCSPECRGKLEHEGAKGTKDTKEKSRPVRKAKPAKKAAKRR